MTTATPIVAPIDRPSKRAAAAGVTMKATTNTVPTALVEGDEHQLLVGDGDQSQNERDDHHGVGQLAAIDVEDPPEQQLVEVRGVAGTARDDHDAEGEECGHEDGETGVVVDADVVGQHDEEHDGDQRSRGGAEQERLAGGEGDGDAGKDRVLQGFGEKGQPPQENVYADDAAERPENQHLDECSPHELELVGLDEQPSDHRAVTIVAPPASTTALDP